MNTERDIETTEHTFSTSMAALYVQGSSSQASQIFSTQGASFSNTPSHANIPSTTVGIITPGSYYPPNVPQVPPVPYNLPPSPYNVPPSPPISFPYNAPGYGYGFIGSTNSYNLQSLNSMSSSQSCFQQRPYYGGSQRNNGGYRFNKGRGNNGGYKKK